MSQSEREDKYFLMTSPRLTFKNRILGWLTSRLQSRYTTGQREHGGDLWNKATMPHLGSELIDACTYYYTLKHRMHFWREDLQAALDGDTSPNDVMKEIHAALNRELGPEFSDEVYKDELPDSGSIL